MESFNIYSPTSASFVSEPYGLSEFHKWVLPQILKDTYGDYSPISSSFEDINRLEGIYSQSFYMEADREFLSEKYHQWFRVYVPLATHSDMLATDASTDTIYSIVPKQFKKSIYEP